MLKRTLSVAALLALLTAPSFAVSKEMVQLQQQVALLMAQVQDLQKLFVSETAVVKSLITQDTDTVNKMTLQIGGLQQTLASQATAMADQQSKSAQQAQSLQDSIDELRARLNKMGELLQQIQQAQQNIPATNPAPAPGTASNAAPASTSPPGVTSSVLPPDQLFRNAYADYISGSYPLARAELQQFLEAYPNDDHDAEGAYYLGDIYAREHNYDKAVQLFNVVLDRFPSSRLSAAAQLRKALALVASGKRAAGVREFQNLIEHHPGSQEAKQAREELNVLGVTSRRPVARPGRHPRR